MEKKWTTKDGKEILISKMETSHIINSINMLDRLAVKGVENGAASYGEDNNYMEGEVWIEYGEDAIECTVGMDTYKALKEELVRRQSKLLESK